MVVSIWCLLKNMRVISRLTHCIEWPLFHVHKYVLVVIVHKILTVHATAFQQALIRNIENIIYLYIQIQPS